ncbi:MAG: CDP-6-deoxy-delta-3,4-glucoseen reductase [Burkholderiaceae bacterium]|nr:CDP-6-deoxy-delta-3,4-glucoseen reductase [Burkholderiaceae bacterium]
MSFTVTVLPSGKSFDVEPGEFVLEAALRQGVVLPYGCKNGACGSCKSKILEGMHEQGAHSPKALSADEAQRGYALLCCSRPQSDLSVEARVVAAAGDIPIRKMPCRIASIAHPAPDVAVLRLQLPANERLLYLAGQYVELLLRDGNRRAYSMATAPHDAGQIELHVRHMPGGKFTDALFGATQPGFKEKDILRFEGPLGTFFLHEESRKPIVFLASGTGFAPIKAVIEHCLHKDIGRPMTLYWGGRRPHDLYMNELAAKWAREVPHFRYVPVVSDALDEDGWTGRVGFVHHAVIEDFPDLSGHEVYACGAPIVVDSARRDFVAQCALAPDDFIADSFTSAADLEQASR